MSTCFALSGARESFIFAFLWDRPSLFNFSHSFSLSLATDTWPQMVVPWFSNFPSSVNYESRPLLGGAPDWLRLSHVLTAIQSSITRRLKPLLTINTSMVNHERYSYRWDGRACRGSAWVRVSFISVLEALEEDGRIRNEGMSEGRTESKVPRQCPASGVIGLDSGNKGPSFIKFGEKQKTSFQ